MTCSEVKQLTLEKQLYILGIVIPVLLLIPGAIYLWMVNQDLVSPCVIFTHFHVYCPGCGGTRAVLSLCRGKILESLWYHPLVPYGAAVYVLYMGSHTLDILSHGMIRGLKFRAGYLWTALILMIGNVILKNVLLLGFGITLESVF
jgi:hypothetical protein